jgi:hypothetical protein
MIYLSIFINKHFVIIFALLLLWVQVALKYIKKRKFFLNSIWVIVEILVLKDCVVRNKERLINFLFENLSFNIIELVVNFHLVCFWGFVTGKCFFQSFILSLFFILDFWVLVYLFFLWLKHIFFFDFAEWAEVIEFVLVPTFVG